MDYSYNETDLYTQFVSTVSATNSTCVHQESKFTCVHHEACLHVCIHYEVRSLHYMLGEESTCCAG